MTQKGAVMGENDPVIDQVAITCPPGKIVKILALTPRQWELLRDAALIGQDHELSDEDHELYHDAVEQLS